MESHAKLQPTFIYGYTSSIRGGAHFVDDETIVFPIGRVLAFHDIERNTQWYVKVKSTFKINAVAISPNRKVVAVGIVGAKPAISFYDTSSLKRLMTVGNPAEGFKAKIFEHLAFTQDSVYLVAVTSEPEGLLIYYKWETGGVVAHTKADGKISTTSSVITVVAPHPHDSSVLAIGGIGLFRLMTLYYNEWRQYGFKRAEYWPISGVCWITPELVLVGTRDGRLMVIEDALMKGEFRVQDLLEIRVSEKDDSRKQNITDWDQKSDRDTGLEVRGLTAFSQGFAFAFLSGEVSVFQKTGKRLWVKKNVIATGAPSLWEELTPKVNFVRYIDISPSEHTLLCTSGASEVYYATIFQEQDAKFKAKPRFKLIHNGFHHGPVSTISTCLYKPNFLSVGATDRTCRIWNFETLKMINSVTFSEDILTAAFHPSGAYCIIAFDETVKVFMILLEGMKPIAVLNCKSSHIVRYSKRGNIFACLDKSTVLVHAGTTFEKLWEFGPTANVSTMHFSANDFVLFTGGLDGFINKYCLKTGQALFSMEIESSVVHDIASSLDGVMLYVVGTDGCLKVVKTSGGKTGLLYSHFLNHSVLNSVTVACDDTVLLVAGQSQVVLSIGMPVNDQDPVLSTYKLHSSPIMKMEVTHVEPTLVSLGRDGVVGIWKLMGLKQKHSFLRYYREVDEVIVNAENWSNKRSIMKEQQEIMNRLDREYDAKVKAIEAEREEQEAKISGRYQGVLDIIGLNNSITQDKNAKEVEKMTLNNLQLREKFDLELDTQRVHFEQRLRSEQGDLEMWRTGWDNVKYHFDQLINSVKMAGQCVAKRLEYFAALELTRRANETHLLKDDINALIEEQKNRELTLIKHSQFEIDELIENSERHEQYGVEIIQLRSQKQKLCEQVEGLESTYFNMQEFLREAHKTIINLDHRKVQKKQVESKQKKIQEKLDAIQESGKDILDNIEVSTSYNIHHMVSEECIEGLCQINHLLVERKNLKQKEQWLRKELVDSSRALNRLRYVLSFLSLQNYLHNNALKKNMSREKDKSRKMHFFRTNLKKEIHSMMCGAESGNLKGRLINLCSQYADPKIDHFGLLDKLSGNKELWKAITHLEATKLHFGNCVSRMRMTKSKKSCETMIRNYTKTYDDDVDADAGSGNASETSQHTKSKVSILNRDVKTKEETIDSLNTGSYKKRELEFEASVEESSSWDEYQTSDDESVSSCKRSIDVDMDVEEQPGHEAVKTRVRPQKEPLSVLINKCKTKKARTTHYGNLLEEKKLIVTRLADVKKRIVHQKKMEKFVKIGTSGESKSERATYKTLYSRIPMNSIIKALNKEVQNLSQKSPVHALVKEMFPKPLAASTDEQAPNTGHLCSLCKGYDMFTKYFESTDGKPSAINTCRKKSKVGRHSKSKTTSELTTPVSSVSRKD